MTVGRRAKSGRLFRLLRETSGDKCLTLPASDNYHLSNRRYLTRKILKILAALSPLFRACLGERGYSRSPGRLYLLGNRWLGLPARVGAKQVEETAGDSGSNSGDLSGWIRGRSLAVGVNYRVNCRSGAAMSWVVETDARLKPRRSQTGGASLSPCVLIRACDVGARSSFASQSLRSAVQRFTVDPTPARSESLTD